MKKFAITAAVLALICLGWFLGGWLVDTEPQALSTRDKASDAKSKSVPSTSASTGSPAKQAASGEEGDAESDQAEIERFKMIDIEHMTKIYQGIMAYLKKHGRYPEQLSQLVPEFITADVLKSPRKKLDKSNSSFATEHADTGLAKPSYAFEFSNIEYRDGRTFAEIKGVQRSEWGDVVPMLRSFAYDKVINVSCRGDVYETQLNWEWDSATLDLAEEYGWGPGLTEGDMVRVRVLLPDGSPATGAKVWADGRNYSFDLPNRPFTTDSDGWATIPVGVDTDRTALVLRAEMEGYASPTNHSEPGNVPQEQSISLASSQRIGGTAVAADGKPMPGARVFLQSTSSIGGAGSTSPPMMSVIADSQGRWSAQVHPAEVAGLAAKIGEPGGTPFKFGAGAPLNPAAAKAGNAVVTVAPSK